MMVRGGETYILPPQETVNDDLYAGGSTVITNGVVKGDLFAGGANITINGSVSDDVTIAGGNLSIFGEIGDDLRMAGGNAVIGKSVKGDVIYGGGSLHILKDAVIEGDLAVGSGSIIIDGTVKGKVWIGGGSVVVNGKLDGEIMIEAEESLTFGDTAVIAKPVLYSGRKEASVSAGTKMNGIEFKQLDVERPSREFRKKEFGPGLAAFFGIGFLVQTLALFIAAMVMLWLFPKTSAQAFEIAGSKTGTALLLGFAVLVLMPAGTFILLLTLIGIPLAIVVLFAWLLLMAISKILSGILLGGFIFKLGAKTKPSLLDWKAALVGVIAVEILMWIPIVGWLAAFIIMLITIGSLAKALEHKLMERK